MDISWVTESSSYDPSYPLVAYVYLVIIAIAFRVYLVVKPLIELYYKFTKTRLKEMKKNVQEILSQKQKKQLNLFLISEISILIFPALVAFLTRLLLGQPLDIVWDSTTLFVGVVFAFIWLAIQFKQSIDMRDFLRILDKRLKYNPKLISFALSRINSTKRRMEKLIQFEPEYIVRDEDEKQVYQKMLDKDEYGKIIVDMEATKANFKELGTKGLTMAHNATELAKSSVQKISQNALDKIDKKVQNTVDDITKPTISERVKSKSSILILSFGPLFVIYILLPWLG